MLVKLCVANMDNSWPCRDQMQHPKAVVILKWIVVLQACCSLGDIVHVRGDAIKGGVPHQRLRPHHVRAYPGSYHKILPCTLPSAQSSNFMILEVAASCP